MSNLKCPFCQQELDCMGKYTDGSSKWLCNKCGLFGDKKLFDEIIRTRKALDCAINTLETVYGMSEDASNIEYYVKCKRIEINGIIKGYNNE